MKTVLHYLVAAVVLAGVLWIATYFFWHIRIVGAVTTLESKAGTPAADDAVDIIESAGCRALPYLIGALDHQKNPHFLMIASKAIVASIQSLVARGMLSEPDLAEKSKGWIILAEDTPPQIRTKCEALQTHWSEHGKLHHKSWRVWTSQCGP